MVKALAHVCLFSHDLARTEAFYCDALGLSVKFRFLREGKLHGFYLAVSETQFIEVFHRDETASGTPQIGHFCLEVDDIQATRSRLNEKGIETTEPRLGADQSWQIWAKDPDGTAIEFHQYTAKSTQFTGADCIVDW